MHWQEKAAALDALAEISLKVRGPGDWYVSQDVQIKDDCVLRGEYGNGATPEDAVLDHWKRLVEDIGGLYLIARTKADNRRAVRWNGFMWTDVPEPKREAA